MVPQEDLLKLDKGQLGSIRRRNATDHPNLNDIGKHEETDLSARITVGDGNIIGRTSPQFAVKLISFYESRL